MKTALTQSHFLVTPGQPARVEIEVTNTADVIDGVTAIVDGINPDWVRLERPLLSLFPEASDRLALVFDIPTSCPAGDYLVVVRIVSTIDGERQSVHDFWITVGIVHGVDLSLRPSIVTGGAEATIEATIVNTGNSPAAITVSALEPTRAVDCHVDPATFVLGPESPAILPIRMRGPRPWFGQPAARQIHVTAEVDEQVVERVATFHQRPRIARGVVTALMLAGIVALWALIFLWVVSELRTSEPAAKALGTDALEGPENIPLAAIAGTFEGTVTAATTGEGLPRITVEALRVDARGELRPVASAATGDDGTYQLPSLIPGAYQVRFSAAGFPQVWYTDGAGEMVVRVDPTQVVSGLDVAMGGQPGRITGSVALPPGSPPTPLQVTATMVVEQAGPGDGAPPSFTQTTTDGTIDLAIPETPATYLVSVSGPGFQTQQFEQVVGGGQASVINTVNLAAADGGIEGLVTDATGLPLGGVDVVARSGTTELRATTPTSGDVGRFRFVGLATPETYVLTFQRTGFSSETKALSLDAGGSATVNATLIGGRGTITGIVTTAGGAPLGGITVEVTGDGFSGETSTLTSSGAGGGAGSFTISGLPVPNDYTITFSGTGVQPETLGATFFAAGTQDVGNVVLLQLTSQVRGRVSAGGSGLGEVRIVLTDGERSQTTISATNPPGAYAFADVPAGSYTLTFERDGFATQVLLVRVEAGVDAVGDVTLAGAS